jgi:hypothetical protein
MYAETVYLYTKLHWNTLNRALFQTFTNISTERRLGRIRQKNWPYIYYHQHN